MVTMRKRQAAVVSVVVFTLFLGTSLAAQSGTAWAGSPKPKISKFKASTKIITTGNGSVTLTAKKVTNAETCTLASSLPVAGLPMAVPCSSVNQVVEFPWNPASTSPVNYTITLTAQGSNVDEQESEGESRLW